MASVSPPRSLGSRSARWCFEKTRSQPVDHASASTRWFVLLIDTINLLPVTAHQQHAPQVEASSALASGGVAPGSSSDVFSEQLPNRHASPPHLTHSRTSLPAGNLNVVCPQSWQQMSRSWPTPMVSVILARSVRFTDQSQIREHPSLADSRQIPAAQIQQTDPKIPRPESQMASRPNPQRATAAAPVVYL